MIHPLLTLTFILTLVPLCAPDLSAAGSSAFSQLSAGSPPVVAAGVPAPAFNEAAISGAYRYATSAHAYFDTAEILNIHEDDSGNDYYPFAGSTSRIDDDGQWLRDGLTVGMTSEFGHPGLFGNGGDTKRIWEDALADYKKLDFRGAYTKIGIVAHLTQDQAVPAHAANINHVVTFGDNLEKSINKDLSIFEKIRGRIQAMLLPGIEPWQYYQVLQDDTRRHLAGWKDPRTNTPYWPPAADAPQPGQDSTKGPWSHYSAGKDTYDIKESPEIADRQTLMAAVYTAGVLKSAARRLPPVVSDPAALLRERDKRSVVDVSFDVHDNRRGEIEVILERPLYGLKSAAKVRVASGGQSIPSDRFSMALPEPSFAVKGEDLIIITVRDADGNISRSQTEVRYQPPLDLNNGLSMLRAAR